MRKVLIYLYLFFQSTFLVSANWYGNHAESFTPSPTAQNCSTDGDSTGGGNSTYGHSASANNNSTTSISPETVPYGRSTTGSMRCLYWDATPATITNISYIDGWTNNTTQTVSVNVSDTGGSGLHEVEIRRYINTNNPSYTGMYTLELGTTQTISVNGNVDTATATYALVNNESYRYEVRVIDIAESEQGSPSWSSWQMGTDTTRVDRDVPDSGDIAVITPSGNFLAKDSQNMRIDVDDENGSDIVRVQGYFEREDLDNNYELLDSTTDDNPGNTSRLQFNWDMSLVDNDASPNNGYRDYRFKITYIEDEAGNSIGNINSVSNIIQTYASNGNYRTYANTLASSLSGSILSENISTTSNIADGSVKNITVQLEDEYGNKIIPVSLIGREVDAGISVDNYLRLNQYTNTGNDSALFIGNTSTEVSVGPGAGGTVNFTTGTTGVYNIPLYVFAPTNNADSLVPGEATIIGAQVNITRTTIIEIGDNPSTSVPIVTPISVYAEPLYESNFSGDIVDLGFIDGASQNSLISIVGVGASSRELYLEFGGNGNINMPDIALYGTGAQLIPGNAITESQDYTSLFKNTSGYVGTHGLESLLEVNGVSPDLGNLYLASIVEYIVGGKNVTYPSGIINKDAYYDVNFNGVNNELGIQILGNTSSQNTQEIIENQFADNVRILGQLVKSTFRRDISQSVYNVIRNIPEKTSGDTIVLNNRLNTSTWNAGEFNIGGSSRGQSIVNESILYFGEMGGNFIELSGATNIEGNKTIIVENGDVYISGNILNPDNDGILGIIVIGGDIFIDPQVTEIHAILYTNKSVLSSSNGINSLPGTTAASSLANQLYIRGSVFSENTLGGSRNIDVFGNSNPLCPYYISSTSCSTPQGAQIYDFNYLRRYFIYDSNSDGTINFNDNPAYSGLRSVGLGGAGNPSDTFPVVIEYNPIIQESPPPFFE